MEIKGWLASKPKEAIVELWRRKLRQRRLVSSESRSEFEYAGTTRQPYWRWFENAAD